MLIASCHCGAIRIEVARKPSVLRQCTCSICRRYGALWAYCTPKTARVLSAPGAARAYVWNDRVIEFYHCTTCGCPTHYESAKKTDDSRIAVNCRMMAPEAIAGIEVRTFDGADTWKYLDQPDTLRPRGRVGEP
jgi:hypothetical protein